MDHLIQNLIRIARLMIPYKHQEGVKEFVTHIMRLLGEGARKVPQKVQKCANRTSCSPEYTGKVTGLSSCPHVEQKGSGERRGLQAVRPHV